MLGFVQSWFSPKANPIGVDFGSDCLRLAQVQWVGHEYQLVAAASADVPASVRHDPAQRLAWFVETGRDLLAQGKFRGRAAVLGLPAAWMHIQHLRLPRMDDAALKKALAWEARGKLPIDPAAALMRHLVAGDIYHDQQPKSEVIVMAAGRELVEQFLAAAGRARLDVVGMNVEPKVIVDCFGQIHRRKSDAEVTSCFIDIGACATRAVIARGEQILFARSIPVGGDQFTQAVAAELKIDFDDARLLRIKMACQQPALDEHRQRQTLADRPAPAPSVPAPPMPAPPAMLPPAPPPPEPEPQAAEESESFALLSAGLQASARRHGAAPGGMATTREAATGEIPAVRAMDQVAARLMEEAAQVTSRSGSGGEAPTQAMRVEQAVRSPLNRLIEELDLCRRYYEATFPAKPVERLIFIGGEARQRGLCQQIARQLGLAAQVGDPLVRMGRISEVSAESGIDRRQPQPGWTVAIGLSMGPASPPTGRGAGAEETSGQETAGTESNNG